MDYIKYLQIKNQQVNDSVRNLTMGHVWIFLPDNNTNWAQNQASAMAIPVLGPEPCSEEMKHQHGAGNLKDLLGAVNCGQRVFEKNIYFIMIFPPFFFLLSNERLDFCDFLK